LLIPTVTQTATAIYCYSGDPPAVYQACLAYNQGIGQQVANQRALQNIRSQIKDKQQQIEAVWEPGDDITMAIGQGNLLVSPLQQAVAYSALENGGKVVTPHVGQDILKPGSTSQVIPGGAIAPKAQRDMKLSPTLLSEIKQGLYGATHAGDGTSSAIFGNFQPTVYGKTGTAEVPTATCPNCSDAWWAGWASQGGQSLVVVAFIHDGGHGGVSAAPVAASVFQEFFSPNRRFIFHAGSDQSR